VAFSDRINPSNNHVFDYTAILREEDGRGIGLRRALQSWPWGWL
jgi:hypothetical protein